MKRFRRWLFNGIAALSLLFFIATAVVFVRSYWISDNFLGTRYFAVDGHPTSPSFVPKLDAQEYSPANSGEPSVPTAIMRSIGFATERGEFKFARSHMEILFVPQTPGWDWLHFPVKGRWQTNRLGFSWETEADDGASFVHFIFPIWAATVTTAVLPVFWLVQWRRNKVHSARKGYCRGCGYDLRATPGKCPECGMVPEKGKQ